MTDRAKENPLPTSSEPTARNQTRELAAIMFSDIAGYTLIMGRDEDQAVRALAEHRKVLRSLLPKFSGRLIGEIGDGTLSSFHSALDAVNCACEVQSTLSEDPELQLRIGIHVGDVLFQDNTVLGDGVNVASRIHSLAPPGGICVSERVYDDIRNKPEIDARPLGEKTLKNVSHPIKVYAITNAGSSRVPVLTSGPGRIAAKGTSSARTQTLMVSLALVFAVVIGVAAYSRFRTSTTLAPSLPQSSPSHVDLNIAFCRTSDGVRIAYATVGKASALPVVEIVGWNSHLERSVEGSTEAQYLQYMGEHYLYVRYDGRGSGLSDRGEHDFSLDARVRDLEAVMDALKLRRAALFGDSAGGATAIAYTVRHPERVSRLVLYGSFLQWAQSAEQVQRWKAMITLARTDWGTDAPAYRQMWASLFSPDATPSDASRVAENERKSMTAEDATAFLTATLAIDATALAPKVAVPTLVIHCRGDLVVPFEQGRRIATLIPGARLVTLENRNHIFPDADPVGMQFFLAFTGFLNEDPQILAAKK